MVPRPREADVELLVDRLVVEVLELAEDHDRRLEALEATDRGEADEVTERLRLVDELVAPAAGFRDGRALDSVRAEDDDVLGGDLLLVTELGDDCLDPRGLIAGLDQDDVAAPRARSPPARPRPRTS